MAAVEVPDPTLALPAVPTSAPSVQLDPFQDSLIPTLVLGGVLPAKDKAASVFVQTVALFLLAVFKFATSVQLVPLYSSVSAVKGSPPATKAES